MSRNVPERVHRGRLVQYANGKSRPVGRNERQVAQAATGVYNEVRLTALKADGAFKLAAHLMDGLSELDMYRQRRATDEVGLNAAMGMADIQATAFQQVRKLQEQLFQDDWNL